MYIAATPPPRQAVPRAEPGLTLREMLLRALDGLCPLDARLDEIIDRFERLP